MSSTGTTHDWTPGATSCACKSRLPSTADHSSQAAGDTVTNRTPLRGRSREKTIRLVDLLVHGSNAPGGNAITPSTRYRVNSSFLRADASAWTSVRSGSATTARPPGRRYAITCCRNSSSVRAVGNGNCSYPDSSDPHGGAATMRSTPVSARLSGSGFSSVSLCSRLMPSNPFKNRRHRVTQYAIKSISMPDIFAGGAPTSGAAASVPPRRAAPIRISPKPAHGS